MSLDIGQILDGWGYRPGMISARKVEGSDGRAKIQLRLDMGLLQMEWQGRPDGQTPHGRPSLLSHYKSLARKQERAGRPEAFVLSAEDCVALHLECLQYYHRRLAFFELKEFEGARRDAEHTLQTMDLVKAHASSPEYVQAFEQHRALVLAHRTRADVWISLRAGRVEEALGRIEQGIRRIEEYLMASQEEGMVEGAVEVEFLRRWAGEIREDRPVSPGQRLRAELDRAVRDEDFERAAELRDMIRGLMPKTKKGSAH